VTTEFEFPDFVLTANYLMEKKVGASELSDQTEGRTQIVMDGPSANGSAPAGPGGRPYPPQAPIRTHGAAAVAESGDCPTAVGRMRGAR